MLKKIIAIVFIFLPGFAFAQDNKCPVLQERENQVLVRAAELVRDYREEVSVFGFSTFMIKETDYETAGKNIIRMANIINGCKALISDKTCQLVSKEIISLISDGVALCAANKKLGCGLC